MITDYIPRGYKKRVSRKYLGQILHETDRSIRREIAECPEVIIHDHGYFIPEGRDDLEHIESFILRETARANAIRQRVEKAREIYFRIEGKNG